MCLKNKLLNILCIFETGAIFGWIYEVILRYIQKGMLVNRGMLHGPWLPIYGIGCVLLYFLYMKFKENPFQLFLASFIGSGILEYFTSWLLEVIYHTRWWDYSHCMMNINGRVFLGGLIIFALAGALFSYLCIPRIILFIEKHQDIKKYIICILIIIILDLLISLVVPNMGIGLCQYFCVN